MSLPPPLFLFPTDFSPHSDVAFEHAEKLAFAANAKLLAVHVCNMPDMPWSTQSGMTHHEDLKSRLKKIDSSRVEVEHVFTVADPGPEICRIASERNCKTIVMGVTNKSGPDQFLCGSVHEFLERNASCQLITLCQQPPATQTTA